MTWSPYHGVNDVDEIIPNVLYIGIIPEDTSTLHKLDKYKIASVVNVSGEYAPTGRPTYHLPLFDDAVHWPPMLRIHDLAERVAKDIKDGTAGPVYVHCAMGINRSALMSAVIMSKLYPNLTGRQIYRKIKKARPATFGNPLFEDIVKGI